MYKTTRKNTREKTRGKTLRKSSVYEKHHYSSRDGFKTSIWGPAAWHLLHTISFNYPVKPSQFDKRNYRNYVLSLMFILPCGKCRQNFCKNLKKLPLRMSNMRNRATFSKYIYDLHEVINKMLDKKSNLTYEQVRDRYEDFRARCSAPTPKNKDAGCTEPLYGEKAKCVLQIVPETVVCETFQVDELCKKKRA
jgi:Erv1 / Alr family